MAEQIKFSGPQRTYNKIEWAIKQTSIYLKELKSNRVYTLTTMKSNWISKTERGKSPNTRKLHNTSLNNV